MTFKKPINRSPLRMYFGKQYFRIKRYVDWYCGRKKYAFQSAHPPLAYTVFQHQTPLLRRLNNVDMQLQYNKIKNLTLASAKLNGTVIRPGETFSYWRLIGNPTSRKGYLEGMVLFQGQVTAGIGGGLCQLSNLIYWMTLHTPLTVTERYRHSYDVFPDSNRNQPFGSGATCFYNYLDLQIRNDTSEPYQLLVSLTDSHLAGEWRTGLPPTRTYEVYEKDHWITSGYWGGYIRHNTIRRRVFAWDQTLIDDEFVTENHAVMMYEPLLAEPQKQQKDPLAVNENDGVL